MSGGYPCCCKKVSSSSTSSSSFSSSSLSSLSTDSSGSDTIGCDACINGIAPRRVRVTLSGIAGAIGDCCDTLNGTYIVEYSHTALGRCVYVLAITNCMCDGTEGSSSSDSEITVTFFGGLVGVTISGATGGAPWGITWRRIEDAEGDPMNCCDFENLSVPFLSSTICTGGLGSGCTFGTPNPVILTSLGC